jgi:hypothetical protein
VLIGALIGCDADLVMDVGWVVVVCTPRSVPPAGLFAVTVEDAARVIDVG